MIREFVYRGLTACSVRRPLSVAATVCICVATMGCSSSDNGVGDQRSTGGATPQTFRNISIAAAYDAGAAAMRENFKIVRVNQGRGVVEAGPESFSQRGGTARVTDPALKPTYQMRRFGTLWIADEPDGVVVNCQIRVQRMDTTDYRSLKTHQEFGDVPSETPIDNEAGLTANQREAWTELSRDQTMERQILGAMNRQLRGESSAPGAQ